MKKISVMIPCYNEEENVREICAAVIDVLEKDNAVYDEFREAIYKREKLGVTCLDTGVALPHADPQTIKKSRIILLTLKHPVDWG